MAKAFVLAALLALACTQVSASSISANVNNNQTGTWMDLFQPPYNSGPSIMMAISCNSRWTCYIPGGSNGAGFQMYLFPGVPNGQFTTLKMPNPPMMMMAIALGGSTSNPGGAVAGIGFGNGIQYPVDNVTFMPSTTPEFIAPSQDVRASRNGQDVLVINAGPNAVQYSSNGGKNFTVKPINVNLAANCTYSRYGAMIDANTWYVSMGSWPSSKTNDESQFHLSQGESVSRCPKTGKVSRHSRNPFKTENSVSGNGCTTFSAQIVKTTDGGNTWTTQFSQASNFYFNAIECLNATNCVVVGEGSGSGAGVHIYRTTDGNTWTQVYYKPYTATQHYSLMTVRANNGRYFVGGGMQTQTTAGSLILTSVDQGLTWVEENSVPNVAAISAFSFTPSGYGFATGITIYQSSTILRYDPTNPGPSPPQPPTPTIKMFVQEQCSDAACTVGCQNISFPSGQCIHTSSGGSAIVTCGATTLDQQSFTTADCSGASTNSTMPLNQCLQSSSGGYFENICPSSTTMLGRVQNGKKLLVTRRA